jgi:hypothetical protein
MPGLIQKLLVRSLCVIRKYMDNMMNVQLLFNVPGSTDAFIDGSGQLGNTIQGQDGTEKSNVTNSA